MIITDKVEYAAGQKGEDPLVPKGRTRSFDRDAALEQAMLLFWSKGFSATSVADLCNAMGIASPSMYAAFGNKESLYAEAVTHYDRTRGDRITEQFNAAPSAKDAVETLFVCIIHAYTQTTQPYGCMVTLASVTEAESPALNSLMRKGRAGAVDMIRGRLSQAIRDGEISPEVDLDAVARAYVTILQGLSVQARDGVPKETLLMTIKAIMSGWDAMTSSRR